LNVYIIDYPALGPFPNDATVLAEMEFYLIEDLDFHLMVWHPYR
jgi:cyclin C